MRKRMSGSVLLLAALAFSLIGGDFLILAAQDPANPTAATPAQTPQTQPTQPQTTKKRTSKKRRGEMTTTTATGDQTTTPADATTPAQTEAGQTPAQMPAQITAPAQKHANMSAEQTDLSGAYAGTFNCDALGLTGDTTLTVTGNQFTTADGKTGRIVASTTGGYTAVALQTGDVATGPTAAPGMTAAASTPTIVSLRARKRGDSLTLTPAAGSTMQCSFTPSRNVARSRRSRQTPAATGTKVASPAEAGPTPADVTAPARPARGRRGNTRRTPTPTTMPEPAPAQPTMPEPMPEQPIPTQTPSPTPGPSPAPSPSPTPSGSPTPMPSPTPSGSPTPEPAPTATPEPTPSPSPSPSPARPRG